MPLSHQGEGARTEFYTTDASGKDIKYNIFKSDLYIKNEQIAKKWWRY
jgi:hypothetical protein